MHPPDTGSQVPPSPQASPLPSSAIPGHRSAQREPKKPSMQAHRGPRTSPPEQVPASGPPVIRTPHGKPLLRAQSQVPRGSLQSVPPKLQSQAQLPCAVQLPCPLHGLAAPPGHSERQSTQAGARAQKT
jgi:hypothetical protein